jgi:hypothetical protein
MLLTDCVQYPSALAITRIQPAFGLLQHYCVRVTMHHAQYTLQTITWAEQHQHFSHQLLLRVSCDAFAAGHGIHLSSSGGTPTSITPVSEHFTDN